MSQQDTTPGTPSDAPRVLIVDNDPNIVELVTAILTDEGYEVTALDVADHDSIAATVGRLEPDCVLLDGAGGAQFGGSWGEAVYLATRMRTVPTVMFTAHADAVAEARTRSSDRASQAGFAAVVGKPFALDDLLDAVATAVGRSQPFDRSDAGERQRTSELVGALEARGATDIRTSERREWATFVSPQDGRIYQLYWWQRLGRYVVGRYDDDARLELLGQFFERDAAIGASLEGSDETERFATSA